MPRRARGEGAIYQRHDHSSCPPIDQGTGERPKHRCRGRYVGMLDLGRTAGKRNRRPVYGKTRSEVAAKLDDLRRKHPSTGTASTWTIEQWMTYYLDEVVPSRDTKPQTRRGYRSKTRTYIVPLVGEHKLAKLEPRHVQAMWRRMRMACPSPTPICRHKPKHDKCPDPERVCRHKPSHGLKEATLRQTHAILRHALVVAEREGHVDRNVATLVDPPSTKKDKRTPLTLAQARQVLKAANGTDIELRVYLRLYYGLRQGEILGLRWSWVDFTTSQTRGSFRIETTRQTDDDGSTIFDDPKSAKSKRPLPLITPVESRFKVAWAQHLADVDHDGESATSRESGGPQCDHLVFTNSVGGPVDPKRDWQAWTDLLAEFGVPHVAPHAARNTAASLLSAAGVPQVIATAILGHSTIQLTADVYTQTDLELLGQAMDKLSAFIGEAPPAIE